MYGNFKWKVLIASKETFEFSFVLFYAFEFKVLVTLRSFRLSFRKSFRKLSDELPNYLIF